MIDLDAPLPDVLLPLVPTREELLHLHPITVDADRWRRLATELELPLPGATFGEDRLVALSRGDVLQVAEREINGDNAVQLFYASQAWGLGTKARRLPTRLRALTRDGSVQLLEDAWSAVREGRSPAECYELLITPKGRTRLFYFGPAFATKYLYFAGGMRLRARCLILDAVVADRLRPHAWPQSPSTGWWPETYDRYCELLKRWAHQLEGTGVPVAPDQVEHAIFALGR